MRFSIVIPAFNEEGCIAEICERILKVRSTIVQKNPEVSAVECIVVDDGSSDRTSEILKQYHDIRVIRHNENIGYGAALKHGFQEAKGQYIGFLDADGTYPPEFLPELLRTSLDTEADIALGSRLCFRRNGMPLQRYIGNKLFAWLLSWLVNQKITDTASGMRVFKKEILDRLYPLPDGLNLTPAMSTRALHENLKIIEVPMPYDERVGSSKLNAITDGFRFLRTILGIARLYNPLKFFGGIGLFIVLLGALESIKPISHLIRYGNVEQVSVYRFFGIMVLLLTGITVVHFGAFANNVLAILHGRKPKANDLWHKFLFRESVMERLDWVGAIMMVASVLINLGPFITYLRTQNVIVPWAYIFGTVLMFLVGLQLFMGTFLIKILREVSETKARTRGGRTAV